MNKTRGAGGIPAELFQILKDDAVTVLHSVCQQIWKTQEWPQAWEKSVFILIPKKGNAKDCSNYHPTALISHASKVMLKILQDRLHQHVNHELPDVQAGFRTGRGTRDQIANIRWIIEKAREFQKKKSTSGLLITPKPLTVWIITNCGKFLKRWAYQTTWHASWEIWEATVRTRHGTMDWFQIGKGVHQGYILSPCLFNFYAEYIMWNAEWMKHKLESRLPGEISITSDMQRTPPLQQKLKKN